MNLLLKKSIERPYLRSVFSLAAIALIWFQFIPLTLAVVPGPDGGYPGGNTAEGQDALLSLTTGGYNTALGYFSLRALGRGAFNTAVGAGTLLANTADGNTATGAAALLFNTSGFQNTANRSVRSVRQQYRPKQHSPWLRRAL